MQPNFLLSHIRRDLIEEYFEICRYFILEKTRNNYEDAIRIDYYESILLSNPLPATLIRDKLDLEIIAASKEVRIELSDTYTPEFIIQIISSGVRYFFDKMERLASIDVHLRSQPELYSFFKSLSPVIAKSITESVEREIISA